MPKLLLTGDILSADRQHTIGIGVGSVFRQAGGEKGFSLFETIDKGDSILFGNLEAPLVNSKIKSESGKEFFAGEEKFSIRLSEAGYDVLSIANNHILEFGEAGFHHTIQSLQNEGIEAAGIADPNTGSNLTLVKKGDCNIGFAAFNAIHDIPNNNHYAELSEEWVEKAIIGLKEREADLICLSFHWGNEFVHIPSWDQIQFARRAIDSGAHLIIGHHPHVIQPIEQYKHGWIIYSLGNFIFDMTWSRKVRTGMLAVVDADKSGIKSCRPYAVEIQDDYRPVIKEHDSWFDNILTENYSLMRSLLHAGKQQYQKEYHRLLKRQRRMARIGMKIQLACQWTTIPKSSRKIIVRHSLQKLLKK